MTTRTLTELALALADELCDQLTAEPPPTMREIVARLHPDEHDEDAIQRHSADLASKMIYHVRFDIVRIVSKSAREHLNLPRELVFGDDPPLAELETLIDEMAGTTTEKLHLLLFAVVLRNGEPGAARERVAQQINAACEVVARSSRGKNRRQAIALRTAFQALHETKVA